MNLMKGFEQFGFDDQLDITKDEKNAAATARPEDKAKAVEIREADLLLDKTFTCPVCGQKFVAKQVKSKLKSLESDEDFRPHYEGIDKIKYDVLLCNHCGYAALSNTFNMATSANIKLLREGVMSKYRPTDLPDGDTYTYEYAVERYKMALVSTMVKRGKMSEKAYVCLKIAWLRREQLKDMLEDTPAHKEQKKTAQEEYSGFYQQAYEGFKKAISTETPPYCGLNGTAVEMMVAVMAKNQGDYDTALKLLGKLITSPGLNSRLKEKCLDIKDEIMKAKNA